ncbi:hypothetical protein RVR_10551 [Actinacidiphila reveromycinica]|uniref:Uncharacterized protein n=1 Tax=Actinacidiphila reveromycinica TaxID=659352 RepID=A0A7U3VSM0_9ACTN|nr:hypothetical protein RVR_10551 [Streptomyces sp. SN-593]
MHVPASVCHQTGEVHHYLTGEIEHVSIGNHVKPLAFGILVDSVPTRGFTPVNTPAADRSCHTTGSSLRKPH